MHYVPTEYRYRGPMTRALITGITGQDGAYLAKRLYDIGYTVAGILRRTSVPGQLKKLEWVFGGTIPESIELFYSDLTDAPSLTRIVHDFVPDEVYNVAAQSHVGISFQSPVSTATANAIGPMNVLEACRSMGSDAPRFYQASTSEMFGKVQECPQNEATPFYPRSPYGVAKLFSYWLTVNYRESYDLFGCNGILFNHESPIRGENFVTKKITQGLAQILKGKKEFIELGNLEAKRDWGHASDYVDAMWRMMQQEKPEDYVIATGMQHSVRQFCEVAADRLNLNLEWQGEREHEVGYSRTLGQAIIRVSPQYYRPAEVETLLGDPRKALKQLRWLPKYTFETLVQEMIDHDLLEQSGSLS